MLWEEFPPVITLYAISFLFNHDLLLRSDADSPLVQPSHRFRSADSELPEQCPSCCHGQIAWRHLTPMVWESTNGEDAKTVLHNFKTIGQVTLADLIGKFQYTCSFLRRHRLNRTCTWSDLMQSLLQDTSLCLMKR